LTVTVPWRAISPPIDGVMVTTMWYVFWRRDGCIILLTEQRHSDMVAFVDGRLKIGSGEW
jgi:hypothetical protein